MRKLKTKKTLMKRIKISKNGKIMKKHTDTGHLKRKWISARHSRKMRGGLQEDHAHKKIFKQLLGSLGKTIK